MKYLLLSSFLLAFLCFSACNKDDSDAEGKWEFTITYSPDGGTSWGESGTADVTVDGDKATMNVTMENGNTHVREAELDGEKVILKGSYTQAVESDPDVDESITYDGEGTMDDESLTASGTYTLEIPDYQVEETGDFVLTATKK